MATRETVSKAFALLRALFPSWKPTERSGSQPSTLEALCVALADVDDAALVQAVIDHANQSTFAPTLAELRQCIAARCTKAPLPMEAWAEVLRFLHDGRYTRPQYDRSTHESRMLIPPWSHPAIALAVQDIGGLETASATWESDQIPAHRARFDQAYQDRLARGTERAMQAETDKILAASHDPQIRALVQGLAGAMPKLGGL